MAEETVTGAEALMAAATRRGVRVCFANPGTTEMPLVAALDRTPEARGVLGLQENVCTGAADGYARITTPEYGTLVAPQLDAPNHQHLFNMRLDLEIDGPDNTVLEIDAVGLPMGPGNEHGNAIVARKTAVADEREARRAREAGTARTWTVVNPNVTNRLGEPVGYKLVPFVGPTLLAAPESDLARRAEFARHHLWVTRYDPTEMHAAGDHPNQHPADGIGRWVTQERDLVNTDVVLWHTFGTSHLPRPEDWPIMPCDYVGFSLKPAGFFDRNPSLDVPPPEGHGVGHCDGGSGQGDR
ncbi:MAG: thiamine pyrophosphate-binding protein [Catenulispora sp.]